MASVQKSDRLKELLIEERQKSRQLVANYKKTRAAKKQTKQLLMEMMPKFVAIKFLKDPDTNISGFGSHTKISLVIGYISFCKAELVKAAAWMRFWHSVDCCFLPNNNVLKIFVRFLLCAGFFVSRKHEFCVYLILRLPGVS